MSRYQSVCTEIRKRPRLWLVTGAAGFIGSHLVERLLELDQRVIGLDDLSTGFRRNIDGFQTPTAADGERRFTFIEGSICDPEVCRRALSGVEVVLHNAAIGSVPRSLENPIRTNAANVTGFLQMLVAARDAGVKRFVYAASSSTYGDHPDLPKVEHRIGRPLSPYAVTKLVNELYADMFARVYGTSTVGLRYFNVFGPRQDPDGAYAAVIPRWIAAMIENGKIIVNGDGKTTRDFCYVKNVVQANLLAVACDIPAGESPVFNIAVGQSTSLNELFAMLQDLLSPR